ncbi:hypothetical protein AB0B15_38255 [Streptomyces sp. NPDC045456]|uniref:hypothetical protein n=1 Tax=Streptomyces sp. NPDC045456 TaxID=3155254 RepID=UPI0033CC2FB5
MVTILCGECSNSPYVLKADHTFECIGCGNVVAPDRDLVLEYDETWAVSRDGILGYVTKPDVCLEDLMTAIEEFLTADKAPDAEYARGVSQIDATDALRRYIDARRAGIARPHIGYTRDQVQEAVNAGADMVLANINIGEPEEDALNLAVNGAMMCLEKIGSTFAEMVEEQYGETVEEVLSWWGWGK